MELAENVKEVFKACPEALEWLESYKNYVHAIDDIIDGDKSKPEDVLKAFAIAENLFSSEFFIKYKNYLGPINDSVRNMYADSIEWEKHSSAYYRNHSVCLSHAGIEMFVAVVRIVAGYDVSRKLSAKLRENAFNIHRKHEK